MDLQATRIVLRRGSGLSPQFVNWVNSTLAGSGQAIDLELLAKDEHGGWIRYRVIGAKVTRSGTSQAMTEEIEMVVERIERG